ncbi:MAG: hypothetical protein HGA85_05290 [Nanoarchaeota archaeon]|nr:hypothetical protein [Nanoarchaeota archaeon]
MRVGYLVLLMLVISCVSALDIGTSPSIMHFSKMLKGGYAEQSVLITTSSSERIVAHLTAEGDIREWVNYSANSTFVFSKSEPYGFVMVLQPPEDTMTGNYTGVIKITTDQLASVTSGAGSSVVAQIMILVYVEVIGEEVIECRAGAISASTAEIGSPFTVRATVHNDGNVRLRPTISVDVYDQYKTKIVLTRTVIGNEILPTRSLSIAKDVSGTLEEGQYFAEIFVRECGISQTVTFDIVEKGAISDSGVLVGIKTNPKSNVGELLPLAPLFRNDGPRKVVAKFRGEVKDMKSGKIIAAIESDSLEVNPGSTMEFPMTISLPKAGEYQISGRVVYNNKITFEERSIVVEVEGGNPGFEMPPILYFFVYIIIGLLIMILIGKIRKAKKNRRK